MPDSQNLSDLQQLYQELIIDHYRNPRNFHKLDRANRRADGFNPLCGDKLSVYVEIEDAVIKDIGFTATGCAIFIASASMMTEIVKLRTIEEAKAISESFHQLLSKPGEAKPDLAIMEKLSMFSGVREYPARIKCATLAWKTLNEALESVARSQ
jgi:nitrogen fixation NifU-like protein